MLSDIFRAEISGEMLDESTDISDPDYYHYNIWTCYVVDPNEINPYARFKFAFQFPTHIFEGAHTVNQLAADLVGYYDGKILHTESFRIAEDCFQQGIKYIKEHPELIEQLRNELEVWK